MHLIKDFTVFLVDDDAFYLSLFKHILQEAGFEKIKMFENGLDCLNTLHEKPNLIFLDYHMDTYNGLEILKKIKRYDPNVYVVMVSAQDDIKPAIDSLKYGAFDYIEKGNLVEKKIENVLSKLNDVEDMLLRSRPSLLKKVFKYL